ncbi:hypothetical protein FISHEDRAFT_67837 [Fistulina hepatica ATCC 64428]|nr:hypothetical protein FISHEDRAFT_67837 [Fistulina hepatica ATCC 64428]
MIPCLFVPVDLIKSGHKNVEYVAHQPFGRIPYIVRIVLNESRAIARHLCAKYPDRGLTLVHTEPRASALFEMQGLPTDEPGVAKALSVLGKKLDVFDRILAAQMHLTRDTIMLADTKPNVARWFRNIMSRSSYLIIKDGIPGACNEASI